MPSEQPKPSIEVGVVKLPITKKLIQVFLYSVDTHTGTKTLRRVFASRDEKEISEGILRETGKILAENDTP